MKRSKIMQWAACVLLLSLLFTSSGTVTGQELCLEKTWNAFNSKKYEMAIQHANDCIESHGWAALKIQQKIEELRRPCPPTGAVDDATRDSIFALGLLNDVAAAYYLKGRSAEYLFERATEKEEKVKYFAVLEKAYGRTCKLRCGRVWDPRGWFWSPCEVADQQLKSLKEKQPDYFFQSKN